MRFSNFLFPESRVPDEDGRVIDEALAEAQLSDALGMDVVWLAEHHFDGNCAYVDPVTFAAAIAASTRRIKIGFAVAQMSLHHPIRLAEQMALVDNLSHGRLIVGLGRGTAYNIYEYLGYGIDPAEAQARLIEAEEIIVKAWTTENYEHRGKFWQLRLPLLRPRPYTKPHPQMIRACSGEASIVEMGHAGRPFLMNVQSNAITAERVGRYRAAMREAGHDEAAIRRNLAASWGWRNIVVAESDAEARRVGVPAFEAMSTHRAAMRQRVLAEQGLTLEKRGTAPPARVLAEHSLICGSPASVIEQIAQIDETGIGGLILAFRLGPMASDVARRSLSLFMTEVAPAFRRAAVDGKYQDGIIQP
ncbi:MAG: LLM class flavin-dependent oxidoreductase [Alphaproteobacteria bacterium]|nr:LLM class flavin-dependent oxidoreductase [Alphaproteobacteria bacterium]